MTDSSTINWNKAKKEALEKIQTLPTFTDTEILTNYDMLLQALKEPEIQAMDKKLKTFVLHERFSDFAMAYGALFNLACLRPEPVPKNKVAEILAIARLKQNGSLKEDKARGIICDLAETERNNKGKHQTQGPTTESK
jgi:hypothetical protein